MEKKIYEKRVIPFVKYIMIEKNGKMVEEAVDSFTRFERDSLSCEPRMLWELNDHIYVAENPLVYNEGTGVKRSLYYVFDEFNEEEQKKYFDRSILIKMTKPEVVMVYGEASKTFFGKMRVKKRK